MKYYIIAGEASGDLHAANLMKALKEKDAQADFRVWGGDFMEAAGGQLVKHYRDLAFMGFWEVLKNIRTILANFRLCKDDILTYAPDVLILVDYPGFNLRMAKWAKARDLKIFYYISPQIWAWHSSRVHGIRATIDRVFVILPFEKDFYKKYNVDVDFVGHPLLDVIADKAPEDRFLKKYAWENKEIVALLPGSRKQEISRMLEIMLAVAQQYPDKLFVIAGAPAIPDAFYQNIIARNKTLKNVHIVSGETYALLENSHAALVTSGTATLETALHEVPQVVCYKADKWSYRLAKRLVNVRYISLVNLILEKELVKELIQDNLTPETLATALEDLLRKETRDKQHQGYKLLKDALGNQGASRRCANLMYKELNRTV